MSFFFLSPYYSEKVPEKMYSSIFEIGQTLYNLNEQHIRTKKLKNDSCVYSDV